MFAVMANIENPSIPPRTRGFLFPLDRSSPRVYSEDMELPYSVELGSGDAAEADSLEGIVLAARTLWDEATCAGTWKGHELANFMFRGAVIHTTIRREELK